MLEPETYSDTFVHDAKMQKLWDESLKCDMCGNVIEDKYYDVHGDIFCEDCLDDAFRRFI